MIYILVIPILCVIALHIGYKIGFSKGRKIGHEEVKEWHDEARKRSTQLIAKIKIENKRKIYESGKID